MSTGQNLQEIYWRPAAFCIRCCTMNDNMCGLLPQNCCFVIVMIEKQHDSVIHVIHHSPMKKPCRHSIQPPFLYVTPRGFEHVVNPGLPMQRFSLERIADRLVFGDLQKPNYWLVVTGTFFIFSYIGNNHPN